MFRFVLHTANVGPRLETMFSSSATFPRTHACMTLWGRAVRVPLVSALRYYEGNKHLTRAIMSQTSTCKQQRWLSHGEHPCFRALTTLYPRIRRPKATATTTPTRSTSSLHISSFSTFHVPHLEHFQDSPTSSSPSSNKASSTIDYDDFIQGDPSAFFTWSDGKPGATSPGAVNCLQVA
jgi:hypothetical protein